MATDYAKKTNAELVEVLKSRNLPHTGKKADMVARLQEDDNKEDAAPAKTDIADDVIDWEDDDVTASAKPAEAAPPAEEEASVPTEETKAEGGQGVAASREGTEGTVTESPEAPAETEEKPAPNFSIGLSVTDLEEELRKRKARAEKFGITEDSQAAIDDAEKKLERAKRFGAEAEAPSADVSRLDQALPEKSRKRGRGENDQGTRGGKRRTLNGRNNQRQRGRNNQNPSQNQKQGQGQKRSTKPTGNGLSDKDRQAMEARKQRFAT
ncbi:hypothetical protein BDW59DRAFT_18894 [Aspergillus cavernicola]|uniref:SAP domain-containing protein n=1 Tax=Aspergillus cavernicola TaxID=176166 RepID=A0ABR4IS73_9EURO